MNTVLLDLDAEEAEGFEQLAIKIVIKIISG